MLFYQEEVNVFRVRSRSSRAFALIAVMALTAVLVLLLGALVGTNRTAFGLLRFTQSKDRIDRTLNSVYSYCRFRLEHDFRWGKEPFEGRQLSWSQLKVTERSGSGEVRTLVGEDSENGTRFEVKLVNNLRSDGEVAILADMVADRERRGVPVGFCRLEIAVEADGQVDGAEVMVRNPGLVGAVCLSSDDLDLHSQSLAMITRDPVKNQARSDKSTLVTGMANFLRGDNVAAKSVGEFSDADPVFWSGDTARFRDSRGQSYQGRRQYKETHPAFKDERFLDGSEALFGLPQFGVEDLAQVRAADGSAKRTEKIRPGVYRFEQYGLANGRLRVLTVRDLGPSGDPGRADGAIREFYYMNELDPGGAPASNDTIARLVGAPASMGTEYVSPSEAEIQDQPMKRYAQVNSGGGAYVDLRNRRFVLDEAMNFEVDGPLGVIGSSPPTSDNPLGDDDLRQVNPAIYFGDPERIAKTDNYSVEGAATVSARSAEKGSLRTSGPLTIQGDISGSTTLASGGDVTIRPGRFFDPQGNSEINFSVFSEGDVRLLPPPILEDAEDRVVTVDGEVSILANQGVNVSEKDLKLTGLLYAQGSVKIDLQDTVRDDSVENRRNLVIEGSVVARRGGVSVVNGDHLELVYNPQFVDQLLPDVARRGRRIEVTGWRVTKPERLSQQQP